MTRSMRTPGSAVVAASALAALVLGGCAVGPDYKRPPVGTPEILRGTEGTPRPESFADQAWWEIFQDDALKRLINESLQHGFDVRLAAARVEEARSNAGIARAEYFPALDLQAGWSRSRVALGSTIGAEPISLYNVNLGMSWELDLWGRVRRLNQQALAQYLATEEARRGVLLSLVADVAQSYFALRELDLELDIARRTAGSFQETLDLVNRRLEAGAASALETASAEASLASTAATIPDLERQIAAEENRLAFLVGRLPDAIPRGATLTDQALPDEIPAGLPADLLERRPDLREAEQRMVAANAEVGVTVAEMFPTISLTGALGGVSQQASELFGTGRTWSYGAGLLSPLFQGRRLKNRHHAAIARWEQTKVEYERSVSNAFSEAASAIVAYQKLALSEEEQARSVKAYRQAVDLSNERYVGGLSDYLDVLLAQRQLFPAEIALARTRLERLTTLVQLYKALGGGWSLKDEEWARPDQDAAEEPATNSSSSSARASASISPSSISRDK